MTSTYVAWRRLQVANCGGPMTTQDSWEPLPRETAGTWPSWGTRPAVWFTWRCTTGRLRKVIWWLYLPPQKHTHTRWLAASWRLLTSVGCALHSGRNPCQVNNGGCSQLCLPTSENTRSCSCTVGYNLRSDRVSCEGNQWWVVGWMEGLLVGAIMSHFPCFRCRLFPHIFHPRGNPRSCSGSRWPQRGSHAHRRDTVCCGGRLSCRYDTKRHSGIFIFAHSMYITYIL